MQVKLDFSILDGVPTSINAGNELKAGKLYYKLEAEEKLRASIEDAMAKQLEVYAAHQDAIIKAGQLTSDITKGIQSGEKPEILLLKAIECISLITGDKLFYELNKGNLENLFP